MKTFLKLTAVLLFSAILAGFLYVSAFLPPFNVIVYEGTVTFHETNLTEPKQLKDETSITSKSPAFGVDNWHTYTPKEYTVIDHEISMNLGQVYRVKPQTENWKIEFTGGRRIKFINKENGTLVVKPTNRSQVGEYEVEIVFKDEPIQHRYRITVDLEPVNMEKLRSEILEIVGEDRENISVGIYDEFRDKKLYINRDRVRPPASISKLPVAILTLQAVEGGEIELEDTYPIKEKLKSYSTDPLYEYEKGTELTIEEYLDWLITHSDNTAMSHLEEVLGGVDTVNKKTVSELGVSNLYRVPHTTDADSVMTLLKGIYDEKFLDSKNNNYLLDLLKNTGSWYDDRIVAGVEEFEDAEVAHKIGNLWIDGGTVVNDSGIVYGRYTDFDIVVLFEGKTPQSEKNRVIATVSNLAYKELNGYRY